MRETGGGQIGDSGTLSHSMVRGSAEHWKPDGTLRSGAAGCRLRGRRIRKTEFPFRMGNAPAREGLARFTKRSGRKRAGRKIGEDSYGCRPRYEDHCCIF